MTCTQTRSAATATGRTYERLRDLFARIPELSTRKIAGDRNILDVEIDAAPHGSAEHPRDGWLIERPNYDFVVRWGSGR